MADDYGISLAVILSDSKRGMRYYHRFAIYIYIGIQKPKLNNVETGSEVNRRE